ncbi:Glycosyltransferase involved in cell wall bisynthesis [Riemerella columbipharyngis]|uniref:Glycosyltransferase involved in cell wall bisynthesis n=2 Tax=Riemerella columbipharyngis TaxID=1071918 RepID=A0A1G7EBJ0_9FLAO|nr:Glycosyltransferase involved in cell wall bisynthesis [Riemerella columbipharyngis]
MERVLSIKANYLAEKNNVTILTYRQYGAPVFFQFSPKVKMVHLDIEDPTFTLKEYGFFRRKKIYRSFIKEYKSRVEQFLKENPQDISISMGLGIEYTFLPQIKDKSKKIIEYHFNFNTTSFSCLKEKISIKNLKAKYNIYKLQKVVNKFDRIVVLTKEDAEEWKRYFDKVSYIGNPITIESIKEKPQLVNKKAIAVGRLAYQKGFDYLIDAWKIVAQEYPDWHLDIYGDGELKEDLQAQIKACNLEEIITIHPPTKEIEKEYHDHSIFILSSRFEGFVLALIEAMASGLPCVSFNCKHGPKQMINDGENGFLAEVGDVYQLAEKIKKLIGDSELRNNFSIEAIKSAQRFSLETIMKQWENLFLSLRNNNNV